MAKIKKVKKETSEKKTGLVKRDPKELEDSRCKAYKYLIP